MTGLNSYPELRAQVLAGIAQSGRRAIVQGLGNDMPVGVLAVENVPHTWLFPRMAAICHHGGAGTTAAALAAGVPSIVVPFANDQFAWGQRVHDLGVGTAPIPRKTLTASRLAAAIQQTTQPQLRAQAVTLANQITTEQGALRCAQVVAGI